MAQLREKSVFLHIHGTKITPKYVPEIFYNIFSVVIQKQNYVKKKRQINDRHFFQLGKIKKKEESAHVT